MKIPSKITALIFTSLLLLSSPLGCSNPEPADDPEASSHEADESAEATAPDDATEEQAKATDEPETSDEVDEAKERAMSTIEEEFPDHYRFSSPTLIEEWIFVRVRDERLSHPRPSCEVLRDDGTWITSDKSDELLKIYDAMGVFDGELPSAYDMAVAANSLVGDCRNIANTSRAEERDDDFDDLHVTAPQVERDGDTINLLYFATGSDFRDKSTYRGKVQFTADEIIDSRVDEFIPEDAGYGGDETIDLWQ